jgi:hypothetical protein
MAWSRSEAEDEVAERRRRYASPIVRVGGRQHFTSAKLLLLDFARLPSFHQPLAILHLAARVFFNSVKRILIQRRKMWRVCCIPSRIVYSNCIPQASSYSMSCYLSLNLHMNDRTEA